MEPKLECPITFLVQFLTRFSVFCFFFGHQILIFKLHPAWLSSSFPLPSGSIQPRIHISALSVEQHTGPAGVDGDYWWLARRQSRVKDGTDDACLASAVQWEKRRAAKEMAIVRGLSPSRPRGDCCRRAVWFVPVAMLLLRFCTAFNLDEQKRVVFSGPQGSYFGYSVEFFSNLSR